MKFISPNIMVRKLQQIPLWLYLLLFGLMFFSAQITIIGQDMGAYLIYALNIYLGKGYININGEPVTILRSPLFPQMIAVSYAILGVSAQSAFWVVKFFAIANPIITLFVVKNLFNYKAAATAALLTLFLLGI